MDLIPTLYMQLTSTRTVAPFPCHAHKQTYIQQTQHTYLPIHKCASACLSTSLPCPVLALGIYEGNQGHT